MRSSKCKPCWSGTTPAAFVVLAVLSISIKEIYAQRSPCTTPDSQPGTCVDIDDCPLLANILGQAPRPLPAHVSGYIQKSHCGTVANKPGLCCRHPSQPASATDTPVVSTEDVDRHRNINLLPSTDCGPISTNKLAGGERAGLGEFPWMALLRYDTPEGRRNLCAGSLINQRYILTAAHCVSRLRSGHSLYAAILGEHDQTTNPDCVEGVCNNERQEVLYDKIIVHPSYNTPRYANDIALVRLARDVSLRGDYVKPVCLPISKALVDQTLNNLIVSGWGTTENQTTSQELLKARLRVVPIQDCRTAHRINHLDENQLCAKGNGIIDTCKGDSGGPLVFPFQVRNTGRYVQFGVVSAGARGCGEMTESKPGIYVRVQRYMNWILDNIQS